MKENRCVICGYIIPEGRMICPSCDEKYSQKDKEKESTIKEMLIKIDTIDKVKQFCNLCSKCSGDVEVCGGRFIVSGKSIMGLFSLDLSKPLKVEFYGDIPYEVKEGMNKFIVN